MTSSKIDFSGEMAIEFQELLNKVYNFEEIHGNPYIAKRNIKPHQFFSTIIIQPEIASKLLNSFKTGCPKYDQFPKETFILKEKLLNYTISKTDVPNMLT